MTQAPKPQQVLVVLAGIFGLAWIAIFPPFQAPDEYVHFYRAYATADGQWSCHRRDDGTVGVLVAAGMLDLLPSIVQGLEFDGNARADPAAVTRSFNIPLKAEHRVFVAAAATATYTACPYLPQAVGIWIGKALGLPPMVLLYLGRLTNLACWLVLMVLATRCAGAFGWIVAQAALLPMNLHLAASLSADGVTLGLAFLFTGLVVGALNQVQPERAARAAGWLAVLYPVFVMCKPYLLLWGLVLMAPPLWRQPRQRLALALSLAAGLALLAGWSLWTRDLSLLPTAPWADDARQVQYLLHHPIAVCLVLLRSMWHHTDVLTSMVGILGWFDTPMPDGAYWAYGLLLLAGPLLIVRARPTAWPARLIALAVVAGSCVMIYMKMYIIATPVGAPVVWGVTGRYCLPVLPAILCGMAFDRTGKIKQSLARYHGWIFYLLNAALLLVATHSIVNRYYGPPALPPSAVAVP